MKILARVKVNPADLVRNLFVRQVLDQDHVLVLAELIENGVEMNDKIKVVKLEDNKYGIVDGRHRAEAYEFVGVKEITVEPVEFEDEAEMISYAYRANTGGSKPPTSADTEHTISLLLERGEATHKRIGELLGLPVTIARKYVNSIKSKIERQKLQKAVAAVVEGGLSAAKAAENYEVDVEKVKEALSGKKRKVRNGVGEIHKELTSAFKSHSLKNAALSKKLIEMYEDGDVTEKQVREILKHISQLQKRSERSMADWNARFEAKISGLGKDAK